MNALFAFAFCTLASPQRTRFLTAREQVNVVALADSISAFFNFQLLFTAPVSLLRVNSVLPRAHARGFTSRPLVEKKRKMDKTPNIKP
jgi:hypothetical protein